MDSKNYRVGLLCHYLFGNGSAQYIVLDVDHQGIATNVNQSLSFCSDSNSHICASSNGMLLYSTVIESCVFYHVFNLFTKQYASIPQTQITKRSIQTGFAFDGLNYQIIRIFCDGSAGEASSSSSSSSMAAGNGGGGGGFLEMEVFSSETGTWRLQKPLIRISPELPRLATIPLFSDGAIHFELGGSLLLYNVNNGGCKLIELPNYSHNCSWYNSMTFGQCLWESEGRVHYCYTDFEGIHTWVLLKEQDLDFYSLYYDYDRVKFKWKLAHTVKHQVLMLQNPEIFRRVQQSKDGVFIQWKPEFISPCAYIEDSQTMYLRLPGIVVAYNLRTRTLKEIFSFKFPNVNYYCCLVIPIIYGKGNGNSIGEKGDGLVLPITDVTAAGKGVML